MKIYSCFLVLLAAVQTAQAAPSGRPEIQTFPDGAQAVWDGEYYDYREADGRKMIKIWTPPGHQPVRGLFISGHGGGTGDSRGFARDEHLRDFAMRLGFGVAGLHFFPGREMYDSGAPVLVEALRRLASLGRHPELAHVPFVMYGSSNGAGQTYGLLNYAPERMICFVGNVGVPSNPATPTPAALLVPGVFIVGHYDALVGERGLQRTRELFKMVRPLGARWAWCEELKGHEDGYSFDLYMKLVEQAVAARYPAEADPRKGPVALRELPEESGWLASWVDRGESRTIRLAPAANFTGDRHTASWLMNETMAVVYRAVATFDQPLRLKIREFDRTLNPHIDPGTMFSLGGPVVGPGNQITVEIEQVCSTKWRTMEISDGARSLGKVSAGTRPQFLLTVDGASMVQCLTALAMTDDPAQPLTSPPTHFFVRDPALDWRRPKTERPFSGSRTKAGIAWPGAIAPATAERFKADPKDNRLVAYALNARQEAEFSAEDGKIASFWAAAGGGLDYVRLDLKEHAAEGNDFSIVLSHEAVLEVQAAYGSDGLYLLHRVTDNSPVDWPEQFAGKGKVQFYDHYDVVDMQIDGRSHEEIFDPANEPLFLTRFQGQTTTSKQYQVACGAKQRPSGFVRHVPAPWDFPGVFIDFSEARAVLGIEIELLGGGRFERFQEWFLPWGEVLPTGRPRPEPGSELALALGFNDRDEGEFLEPGITSSGGMIRASDNLRWIGRSDPWRHSLETSKPPMGWGKLIIGPPLER